MSAKSTQGNDKKAIETGEAKNVSGHFSRVTVNVSHYTLLGDALGLRFLADTKKPRGLRLFMKTGWLPGQLVRACQSDQASMRALILFIAFFSS